jgi:aspartate/methionine/tyrosine aminotransferase
MKGTVKTDGAFYFMVKLPDGVKDMDAVTYLAKEWNVMVLPCNSAGLQGYLRVSYGNLSVQECTEASSRLKQGLKAILDGALNKSV